MRIFGFGLCDFCRKFARLRSTIFNGIEYGKNCRGCDAHILHRLKYPNKPEW